jgi:hypothetical protein
VYQLVPASGPAGAALGAFALMNMCKAVACVCTLVQRYVLQQAMSLGWSVEIIIHKT